MSSLYPSSFIKSFINEAEVEKKLAAEKTPTFTTECIEEYRNMEDQKSASNVTGSESSTAVTPSTSLLVAFDVNNFLKKTFSDYDIGRDDCGIDQEPSSSIHQQPGFRSGVLQDGPVTSARNNGQRRKNHQRRAGSVPTTTADRVAILGETPQQSEAPDERLVSDHREASRRGRRRERDERLQKQQCAYCGQDVWTRCSTSKANSARGLYCAACTSFFTRHSPSELQRRIAFDEMTQPSATLAVLPVASVGSSSGTAGDNKETVPLLCGAESNKVVIVADEHRDDDEDEDDSENRYRSQKEIGHQRSEEVEEISRYRYARNDRPQGRGHAERLQVKARQAPHRQQQRPGRVQLRNDSSSKMNSWCGESASVVVWNKDNHANNTGSRRSSCTSASSLNRPTCRICHLYEPGETLVSPCRCAGTMQYVHTTCLVHWLEISTKKVLPSPQCELCGYHYRTHHCYRFRRMHAPTCNHRDRVLHAVFVIMLLVMIGCAALSAVYLRHDKGSGQKRVALSSDDIIVIASALLFFCAFFVAVFTQYRAETSVCRLCLRCWLINRHWRVKDYDRSLDYERRSKTGHSVVMEQI